MEAKQATRLVELLPGGCLLGMSQRAKTQYWAGVCLK